MATASSVLDQKLSRSPGKIGMLVFGVVLVIGVGYAGSSLLHDLSYVHNESILPFVLLGLALLVALGCPVERSSTSSRQGGGSGPIRKILTGCVPPASSRSPAFSPAGREPALSEAEGDLPCAHSRPF